MRRRIVRWGLLAALAALAVSQGKPARSVWDGVYTEEQAKRGSAAYSKECALCHGEMLTGGEMAPPLAGAEFMANWNGLTAGDLFERIRKTMPPARIGRMTREAQADVVAFMLQMNEFPNGDAELSAKTETLKQIQIEMTKPEGKK
jgi:quinoprotein glucose dehydrogenase